MSYPHEIRLRGPWELTVVRDEREGSSLSGKIFRVTVPRSWKEELGNDFRGRVRYRRSFASPTGLGPHEQVTLVVDGADPSADVVLNGETLGRVHGPAVSAAFAIRERLRPRNELLLEVDFPAESAPLRTGRAGRAGGPLGEVRLAIHSGLVLRNLGLHGCHPEFASTFSGELIADLEDFSDLAQSGDLSLSLIHSGNLIHAVILRDNSSIHVSWNEKDPWPWRLDSSAAPNDLRRIEVVVQHQGQELWREDRATRSAWSDWDPSAPAGLVVNGQTRGLPGQWLDLPDDSPAPGLLATALASRPALLVADQVFSDDYYRWLDLLGIPVIQCVPRSWSEARRKLAHHPCVAAWSAWPNDPEPAQTLPAHLANSTEEVPRELGRPWLPPAAVARLAARARG